MKIVIALTSFLLSTYSALATAGEPAVKQLVPVQFPTPVSNTDITENFVVAAKSEAPQPCIAVPSMDEDFIILVSRELIDKLAIDADMRDYKDEAERQNFIVGLRAKRLLESATNRRAVHNCTGATVDGETKYLIGRLLRSGQVAILDVKTGQLVPSIIASIDTEKSHFRFASYRVTDSKGRSRRFFNYRMWFRH